MNKRVSSRTICVILEPLVRGLRCLRSDNFALTRVSLKDAGSDFEIFLEIDYISQVETHALGDGEVSENYLEDFNMNSSEYDCVWYLSKDYKTIRGGRKNLDLDKKCLETFVKRFINYLYTLDVEVDEVVLKPSSDIIYNLVNEDIIVEEYGAETTRGTVISKAYFDKSRFNSDKYLEVFYRRRCDEAILLNQVFKDGRLLFKVK